MPAAYVNIEFPRKVAMGALRQPEWSTSIAETFGGFENANANWLNAKHSYDVGLAVRDETDYDLVLTHFHSVRARFRVFPFKDFLDYRVEQARGLLVETTAPDFQLYKTYGSGANMWTRKITKPLVAGAVFYRTRAAVVSIAAASLDPLTGIASITGHVAGDTYQWSGQFLVPVRYGADKLPSLVVDRRPKSGPLLVKCDSIQLVEVRGV